MRTANLSAVALCAAICAFAAGPPLPELRIEPKTAGSIFYVHNSATQPLTAFLIELVDYPGSTYFYWQDEPGEVVAPGATKEIQVTNMTVGAVPDYVKLRAAIYGDGSTAGDADRVESLVGRRRTALETTRELIRRIEKAGSPDAARTDLTQWSEGMPPLTRSNRYTSVGFNQAVAKSLIADAVRSLQNADTAALLTRLKSFEHTLAASKPALR
jgi:hypothetical protein